MRRKRVESSGRVCGGGRGCFDWVLLSASSHTKAWTVIHIIITRSRIGKRVWWRQGGGMGGSTYASVRKFEMTNQWRMGQRMNRERIACKCRSRSVLILCITTHVQSGTYHCQWWPGVAYRAAVTIATDNSWSMCIGYLKDTHIYCLVTHLLPPVPHFN